MQKKDLKLYCDNFNHFKEIKMNLFAHERTKKLCNRNSL